MYSSGFTWIPEQEPWIAAAVISFLTAYLKVVHTLLLQAQAQIHRFNFLLTSLPSSVGVSPESDWLRLEGCKPLLRRAAQTQLTRTLSRHLLSPQPLWVTCSTWRFYLGLSIWSYFLIIWDNFKILFCKKVYPLRCQHVSLGCNKSSVSSRWGEVILHLCPVFWDPTWNTAPSSGFPSIERTWNCCNESRWGHQVNLSISFMRKG